ncbi:MAG: ComEA family DNA-binding protein [Balneolia bacterium]|nr:ComEA family DNA-binding protein [Balneolia bacterium]
MKRAIYFFTDRLQITSAERFSILVVGALFLLISGIQQFNGQTVAYAEDSYSAVFAQFTQLSTLPAEESSAILSQYYPQENPERPAAAEAEIEKKVQEPETITAPEPVMEEATAVVSESSGEAQSGKVNINSADAASLATLPGVGPAIAARIIEYRNENGPFRQIEDIKNVRGIGEARFEAIKDLITVGD